MTGQLVTLAVFAGLFAGAGLAVCAAESVARWLWSPRRAVLGEMAAERHAAPGEGRGRDALIASAMVRHPAGSRR